MSSSKTLLTFESEFKFKICLLGGIENIKNEFQKIVSSGRLPIKNKQNIGVNISKIDFNYHSHTFGFYLWNINCSQRWTFLRTNYYNGSEAIIVLISETKINQIKQYLEEIKSRLPVIQIIFCVILEKCTKDEIIAKHLKSKKFKSLIKSNNIKINDILTPSEIFQQICSKFMIKKDTNEESDNFIINFIQSKALFNQQTLVDECNDYYEPIESFSGINLNQRINTKIITNYLSELGFKIEDDSDDYLKIKNKKFGTFSIFLKNGKVNLLPIICQKCKHKNCSKYNKKFFVCIEQKTKGWSNDNLGQPELLLLSKIIALKSGILPFSVMKQITKINICLKDLKDK